MNLVSYLTRISPKKIVWYPTFLSSLKYTQQWQPASVAILLQFTGHLGIVQTASVGFDAIHQIEAD